MKWVGKCVNWVGKMCEMGGEDMGKKCAGRVGQSMSISCTSYSFNPNSLRNDNLFHAAGAAQKGAVGPSTTACPDGGSNGSVSIGGAVAIAVGVAVVVSVGFSIAILRIRGCLFLLHFFVVSFFLAYVRPMTSIKIVEVGMVCSMGRGIVGVGNGWLHLLS